MMRLVAIFFKYTILVILLSMSPCDFPKIPQNFVTIHSPIAGVGVSPTVRLSQALDSASSFL
jgi:hypothetical protein